MIHGLERLYDAKEWDPQYSGLQDDPTGAGFHFNGAFGGAMEVEAAEALYAEVKKLAEIARAEGRAFAFAETGTCDGFSTCFIAKAIQDAGADGCVWTAEILERRDGQKPFKWPGVWYEMGLHDRVVPVRGNAIIDGTWAQQTLRAPLPAVIDAALIDSEHAFGVVMAEWAVLWPRIRPNGVCLFHDAKIIPEVAAAVNNIGGQVGAEVEWLNSCRGLAAVRKRAV